MLTETQEAWVQALESGEYEQTESYLRTDTEGVNGYCCLGVACEISGIGTWSTEPIWEGESYIYTAGDEADAEGMPPEVADSLDMRSLLGGFKRIIYRTDEDGEWTATKPEKGIDFKEYHNLTLINDSGKYDFAEIAHVIRKFPELVFSTKESNGV